jgi:hypothetical protein
MLLLIAFAMVGRVDQTTDSPGGGKNLQLQRAAQLIFSPTALDLKTPARKASASWGICLECVAGREIEYRSEFATSRLDGETSARLPLSDLRGLRGRAPPVGLLS